MFCFLCQSKKNPMCSYTILNGITDMKVIQLWKSPLTLQNDPLTGNITLMVCETASTKRQCWHSFYPLFSSQFPGSDTGTMATLSTRWRMRGRKKTAEHLSAGGQTMCCHCEKGRHANAISSISTFRFISAPLPQPPWQWWAAVCIMHL